MHVIQSSALAIGLVATALLGSPAMAAAQYKLDSPAGEELVFERDQVRAMLDTTRALYRNLEEDPAVLYSIGVGTSVPEDNPTDAFPWNAIEVRNDSVALVQTPNNLREADRAYNNYAVLRMAEVRSGDADAPCDDLVAAEARVVSGFVDGWIVARMLFGGPRFEPLDRLAFIREAGHMPAFITISEDPSIGACATEWLDDHGEEVAAYRTWYDEYRGDALAAEPDEGAASKGDSASDETAGPDRGPPSDANPEATGGEGTGASNGS